MSSDDKDLKQEDSSLQDRRRREFVALSTAVGLAAGTGIAEAAEQHVMEKDVSIRTPDGTCDAVLLHPARGKHPAVLIWTDIFGLRPTFRRMGRRVAALGYTVLVPNPFYRTGRAPTYTESQIAHFDFRDPASRAKMQQDTGPINAPGAIDRDAKAHIGFLDEQSQVDTAKKAGTHGYCMGGPLVFRTAAAVPERIGGAAAFHPGTSVVSDKPDAPYRLIPKFRTRDMYVAIAGSDDVRQPDGKTKLREAFAAAHVKAEVVVYTGIPHGWCVPDMPHQPDGKPIYNPTDAERAFRHLVAIYRETLV